MKNNTLLFLLLISLSSVSFAETLSLSCPNLPQKFFPGVEKLEVRDDYQNRFRSHFVFFNDGVSERQGSAYMGEPMYNEEPNAKYRNFENLFVFKNTYDFDLNGITLRLRKNSKNIWYVDPLEKEENFVQLECEEINTRRCFDGDIAYLPLQENREQLDQLCAASGRWIDL